MLDAVGINLEPDNLVSIEITSLRFLGSLVEAQAEFVDPGLMLGLS